MTNITLQAIERDVLLRMRAASEAEDWDTFDRLTEELAALDAFRRLTRRANQED